MSMNLCPKRMEQGRLSLKMNIGMNSCQNRSSRDLCSHYWIEDMCMSMKLYPMKRELGRLSLKMGIGMSSFHSQGGRDPRNQ